MDLSALSVAELNKLLSDIPKEIIRREKGEKARVRKELEALPQRRAIRLRSCLVMPARPPNVSASRWRRSTVIPRMAL